MSFVLCLVWEVLLTPIKELNIPIKELNIPIKELNIPIIPIKELNIPIILITSICKVIFQLRILTNK